VVQAGLVFTCGLTSIGGPLDPTEADAPVPTHGRISSVPAENLSTFAGWEGDDYVLRVTGVMRETAAFGVNLQMTRTVRILPVPYSEVRTHRIVVSTALMLLV